MRQSGVEGSECGGGGGGSLAEEVRSPRKPLLHLTHAMLGVSLPSLEPLQFGPFRVRSVDEKVHHLCDILKFHPSGNINCPFPEHFCVSPFFFGGWVHLKVETVKKKFTFWSDKFSNIVK